MRTERGLENFPMFQRFPEHVISQGHKPSALTEKLVIISSFNGIGICGMFEKKTTVELSIFSVTVKMHVCH